ncbi:MAG: hypothetical protein LBR81_05355 [Prevotellaceae bacterium]|jgi:hypothetical protein|nr:hypothetical protein [Prevotellaceae bacterium]
MKHLFVIIIVLITSFSYGKSGNMTFIDVNKTLDSLERGELLVESIKFNLPSCIYLDCSLKKRLNNILKEDIDYHDYCIKRKSYSVKLNENYKNVDDVVKNSDTIFVSFLQNRFGIRFRDLLPSVLKYNNKVLLNFYDDYNYIGRIITVELKNPQTLKVKLLYKMYDNPVIEEIIPDPEVLPSVDTTIWNKDGTRK